MLRTTLLLGAMTGLIMAIGQFMGGSMIAFVFAVIMNFSSYWFSDKIVLRMYGAQEATEAQAPRLHSIVHDCAGRPADAQDLLIAFVLSFRLKEPMRLPPAAIQVMLQSL